MKAQPVSHIPKRYFSEIELAQMPYSQMKQTLDSQEKLAALKPSIGKEAWSLAELLMKGACLAISYDKANRRHWKVDGNHLEARIAGLLLRRGLVSLDVSGESERRVA